MKKRLLILKESSTKLTVHSDYIEIVTPEHSYVVAFCHLGALYLNKAIKIDIGTCYSLSRRVPLFLIDRHGRLLAELKGIGHEAV